MHLNGVFVVYLCIKCHTDCAVSVSTGVQEKMGIMNRGVVYALWDYASEEGDELQFREGDCMTVVRREDEDEIEWWWARMGDKEGYIPRNLLGASIRTGQSGPSHSVFFFSSTAKMHFIFLVAGKMKSVSGRTQDPFC